MVQFGPQDYAMSIGIPGRVDHPRVKEAEISMIEKAQKKKIAPRVELGQVDEIEPYLQLGVKHFCLGVDVIILYQWLKSNGARLRDKLTSQENES